LVVSLGTLIVLPLREILDVDAGIDEDEKELVTALAGLSDEASLGTPLGLSDGDRVGK